MNNYIKSLPLKIYLLEQKIIKKKILIRELKDEAFKNNTEKKKEIEEKLFQEEIEIQDLKSKKEYYQNVLKLFFIENQLEGEENGTSIRNSA